MIPHPFIWVRSSALLRVFAALAVAQLVVAAALGVIGADLVTDAAPYGIVSFEFAGSAEGAGRILDSWSAHARQQAMLCLGADSLYLIVYSAFLSLACVLVGGRLDGTLARAGQLLAWLVLLAGCLDAVENYGLVRLLADGPSDAWAAVAWWCALVKFALVVAALLYAGSGYVLSLTRPRRPG